MTGNLNTDIEQIKKALPLEKSYDIVGRNISILNQNAFLVYIPSLVNSNLLERVFHALQSDENAKSPLTLQALKNKVAFIDIKPFEEIAELKKAVLSGQCAVILDNEKQGALLDARQYPDRTPEEAVSEKVTRGSRDGFIETLASNTALIRRRLRDPRLIFESHTVGTSSQTDVAIAFIDGLASNKLLASVREKIDAIDVASLVMAEKSLQELLVKRQWFNPLPPVRYTERPDVVTAHLLEGNIAIMVDTSPSVMLVPTSVFSLFLTQEDFVQPPILAMHYRIIYLAACILGLVSTPTLQLLARYHDRLPDAFSLITKEIAGISPLIFMLQMLILELSIDLLKLSSFQIPDFAGSSISVIGGLMLGDMLVSSGFVTTIQIISIGIAAISAHCIPNIEFALAIRLFRLSLIALAGVFGLAGFCIGLAAIAIIMYSTSTIDRSIRYTWPLLPFDRKSLYRIVVRPFVKSE